MDNNTIAIAIVNTLDVVDIIKNTNYDLRYLQHQKPTEYKNTSYYIYLQDTRDKKNGKYILRIYIDKYKNIEDFYGKKINSNVKKLKHILNPNTYIIDILILHVVCRVSSEYRVYYFNSNNFMYTQFYEMFEPPLIGIIPVTVDVAHFKLAVNTLLQMKKLYQKEYDMWNFILITGNSKYWIYDLCNDDENMYSEDLLPENIEM